MYSRNVAQIVRYEKQNFKNVSFFGISRYLGRCYNYKTFLKRYLHLACVLELFHYIRNFQSKGSSLPTGAPLRNATP